MNKQDYIQELEGMLDEGIMTIWAVNCYDKPGLGNFPKPPVLKHQNSP